MKRRTDLPGVFAVLLIAAVLYGGNLNDARTLTDHEAYPAAGAREMLATGNWLVPMDGNHTWLEKPPLLHWLDAASLAVFHRNTEWVVRLPSVLAGLALVFTIGLLASKWFGPGFGFAAGIIQATSYYAFTYARLAEADMLLAMTVALSTYMFVTAQGIGLQRAGGPKRLIAFWCLVGAASLSKGVGYGSIMALLPATCWLVMRGRKSHWKRMLSGPSLIGVLIGLCIALAWPLAMLSVEPGYGHQWLMNTLGRAAGDLRQYDQPWWYYASTMPWQLAPWTPLTLLSLALAMRMLVKKEQGPQRDIVQFCLTWTFVPVFLLSLSAGKHHHYLLPCLPALSLISCIGLQYTAHAIRSGEGWIHGFTVIILVFAGVMLAASFRDHAPFVQLRGTAIAIATCAAAVATLFALLAKRGRPDAAFGVVVLGVSALVLTIHFDIQPRLDGRRQDREFFTSVSAMVPPGDPIIATGGQFVARPIFLVKRQVIGIWAPERVVCHVPRDGVAYVVAVRHYARVLRHTMQVEEVAASRHTNEESGPQDRWALMRVKPDDDLDYRALCKPEH